MAYPMTFARIVRRIWQEGDEPSSSPQAWAERRLVAEDLKRLAEDQRDREHLIKYAQRTGLKPESVLAVLNLFFEGDI